jgi:truncated hemoglobin YjbI
MGSVEAYMARHNLIRQSQATADSKTSSYSDRANASRLSQATADSKATTYTNRINSSRLTGIRSEGFVPNASLFSRIGGADEVATLVRSFYAKALRDERVRKFFDFDDAGALEQKIAKQVAFVSAALGGPTYDGMDMHKARKYLATLELTADQFDAVAEGLFAILRGQNTPPPLMDEMETFFEDMRKEVLG